MAIYVYIINMDFKSGCIDIKYLSVDMHRVGLQEVEELTNNNTRLLCQQLSRRRPVYVRDGI